MTLVEFKVSTCQSTRVFTSSAAKCQ